MDEHDSGTQSVSAKKIALGVCGGILLTAALFVALSFVYSEYGRQKEISSDNDTRQAISASFDREQWWSQSITTMKLSDKLLSSRDELYMQYKRTFRELREASDTSPSLESVREDAGYSRKTPPERDDRIRESRASMISLLEEEFIDESGAKMPLDDFVGRLTEIVEYDGSE